MRCILRNHAPAAFTPTYLTSVRRIGLVACSSQLLSPFRPRTSDERPFDQAGQFDQPTTSGSPFKQKAGFAGGPGASLAPKPHLQEQPTKDRMPPASYNPRDPRRRLAVLIDGSRIDAETYVSTIEPALCQYGVPVLVRVFDTELRDAWLGLVEPALASSGGMGGGSKINNSQSDSQVKNISRETTSYEAMDRPAAANNKHLPVIEWFRMDRFIPVPIQIAADVQHIFDYRSGNKIEGAVIVCTENERATRFEKFFSRVQGKGFSQITFDEKGPGVVLIEDGRDGDGSGGLPGTA